MPVYKMNRVRENWGQTKTTELLELSVCACHSTVFTGAGSAEAGIWIPASAGMTINSRLKICPHYLSNFF
jgi:hypothetical protein